MLEASLHELGLDKRQISVYIELLKAGTWKASNIAKILDMPKSSVLDVLSVLVHMGLVSKIRKKNAFIFSAYEPQKILDILDDRKRKLEYLEHKMKVAVPLLRNLQDITSPKPQIEYLEGRSGLIEAFHDTLKISHKTILCYGSVAEQDKTLPDIFPNYYKERVKRKISTICLIPADSASTEECLANDEKHLRKTYFIPESMALPMEINIYENNTTIMSFKEQFAVIIRSKPVADCYRIIFNLAFEGAKNYDKEIREKLINLK